jgi:hypothetical protein
MRVPLANDLSRRERGRSVPSVISRKRRGRETRLNRNGWYIRVRKRRQDTESYRRCLTLTSKIKNCKCDKSLKTWGLSLLVSLLHLFCLTFALNWHHWRKGELSLPFWKSVGKYGVPDVKITGDVIGRDVKDMVLLSLCPLSSSFLTLLPSNGFNGKTTDGAVKQ